MIVYTNSIFTVHASTQTQASAPPRVLISKFGDGYQQRSKDGDANILQTWQLVFNNRTWAELKVIDDFLRALRGVNAFTWKRPDPFDEAWFTCKNWEFTYDEGDGVLTGITATFEQQPGPSPAALGLVVMIVSGDFQNGVVNTVLPLPLVVQVLDGFGLPVVGFHLTWGVIAGAGHLSATATVTDSDGLSTVTYIMGPFAVTNQIRVIATGAIGSPLVFNEYIPAVSDENWAGNSFDWMTLGVPTDVGTETNVGDTSLGLSDASRFVGGATSPKVILQGGTDKAVILGRRQALVYPFLCPDWHDVRFGIYMSLTQDGADDDPTGLVESVPLAAAQADRTWMGIKDNSNAFPRTAGTSFFGLSNAQFSSGGTSDAGTGRLRSSDSGGSTSNAYFWRPDNSINALFNGAVCQGTATANAYWGTPPGLMHFAQDPTHAGGYACCVLLRMTRPSVGANRQFWVAFQAGNSRMDCFWTDVPTMARIRANMRDVTDTFVSLPVPLWKLVNFASGLPIAFTPELEAFYLYWPFSLSNLKIHALVVEKFA